MRRPRTNTGGGSRVMFSGVAYGPSGYKTEGLNSDGYKPWVKFSADGATFSEELGPPPVPWGTSEVWFEKAATYGNIVVSRLG